METHRRGADGRRLFTAEFKQEQIARVARQELTLAELSRELAVSPSVVRRGQALRERGGRTGIAADADVGAASALPAAQPRTQGVERAHREKATESQTFHAARDAAK